MMPPFSREGLQRAGFAGLRVVADVHGEAASFSFAIAGAAAERLFVLQLGDLTDHGPDSPAALRLAFALLDSGRGCFLLGNHDHKLRRALTGAAVHREPEGLGRTLIQLEAVLQRDPPEDAGARKPDGILSRALFGEVTGRRRPDGFPERIYNWVARIPAGMSVHCGHDRRSGDGRPYVQVNEAGGRAVFLDCGAGKGGHLAWLDLRFG